MAIENALAIDERGSKVDRNSVFDYHLSPVGRQKAIENYVSHIFYLRLSKILTFSIAAYPACYRGALSQSHVRSSVFLWSPERAKLPELKSCFGLLCIDRRFDRRVL